MITTTIRHGDLVLEYLEDGSIRIVRQSTAQVIELSLTEWTYILKVSELHGWPTAPPPSR